MPKGFASPADAEAAFYRAFEQGDVEAMMEVWLGSGTVACIHPGGERLQGRDAVRASWAEIFAAERRLQFVVRDPVVIQQPGTSLHLVRENIYVDSVLQGVMLATNVYCLSGGAWYMVLHHASADPRPPRRGSQVPRVH